MAKLTEAWQKNVVQSRYYSFSGYNDCTAINYCYAPSFNNCHPKAFCETSLGSFSCKCGDGYLGDGVTFCDDIDECSSPGYADCGENGNCTNTDGSYRCDCDKGFELTLSGRCTDVDECLVSAYISIFDSQYDSSLSQWCD